MIIFLLALMFSGTPQTIQDQKSVFINRETGLPQLILLNGDNSLMKTVATSLTPEEQAKSFLKANANLLGLKGISDVKFISKKSSLLGDHYRFAHTINGEIVADSQFTVSFNSHGKITKIFSSMVPGEVMEGPRQILPEEALSKAWSYLNPPGDLLSEPQIEPLIVKSKSGLVPGYRVQFMLSLSGGTWQVDVDGQSGEVLKAQEITIQKRSKKEETAKTSSKSFQEALDAYRQSASQRQVTEISSKNAKKASGSALVFEPDPRTALNNPDLTQFSPAEDFDAAYVNRPLNDIAFQDGTYILAGPYCQIVDLTDPESAPSTTTDGIWDAKRGELAFYDTMCYYHIDRCQRYVQSLGFVGDKAIMNESLRVDSNGYFGGDNSGFNYYYNSQTGEIYDYFLEFGQGGVPDDEDSDVIIHEYGHALSNDINGLFIEGDTQCIGEGFCDYWAASYRLDFDNALLFHPAWMFHWDGHNEFWGGRVLNAFHLVYNPNQFYPPHIEWPTSIENWTDELWSTPCVQALYSAVAMGFPRSEMDTIMLESFYGMGQGTTMRALAENIVAVAGQLYPERPYVEILLENFKRHNIIAEDSGYTYYASHIPPAGQTSVAWQSDIDLTNPNFSDVEVDVKVYEKDPESSQFNLAYTDHLSIADSSSVLFVPPGNEQRWVSFECASPLSGTLSFYRTVDESKTEERVSLPLTEKAQMEQTLIFPHVPSNRGLFWSGGVILNSGQTPQALEFKLIGENGSDLSSLLSDGVPSVLAPYEKWVTYFADGLFDDNASQEKVAFIQVNGSENLMGFELFGYQPSANYSATSGIASTSYFNRKTFVSRCSLDEVEWSGFVLVNPFDAPFEAHITLISSTGQVQAELDSFQLGANQKVLGLNDINAGFLFPYQGTRKIELPPGTDVAFVVVEAEVPYKLFELSGDLERTRLDGTASWGETSIAHFTKPTGTLELLNGSKSDTLEITGVDEAGETVYHKLVTLTPWEPTHVDLFGYNAASISISGNSFFAFLVENDNANGSLTIRTSPNRP